MERTEEEAKDNFMKATIDSYRKRMGFEVI
jgi:hypothetical protein